MNPSISYLKKRAKYWLSRLYLNDWNISVKVLRQPGLRNRFDRANVDYDWNKKTINIVLLHPDDNPGVDLEESLVHEISHVVQDLQQEDRVEWLCAILMERPSILDRVKYLRD